MNAAPSSISHASMHEHQTAPARTNSTFSRHTRFVCEHLLCPDALFNGRILLHYPPRSLSHSLCTVIRTSLAMAQPFDDPFTDDYEYSLPAHPNPLGSHPPPPSRYYKTALRTSEDDAVALSPRSTQTTWSDIELQHRNGTTQEEHDQVAILLEKISPPRWFVASQITLLCCIG